MTYESEICYLLHSRRISFTPQTSARSRPVHSTLLNNCYSYALHDISLNRTDESDYTITSSLEYTKPKHTPCSSQTNKEINKSER